MDNSLIRRDEPKPTSLITVAKDWALTHGITLRTKETPNSSENISYAPFLLVPSPFPREHFNIAKSVQKHYNELYHKVAHDYDFLKQSLQSTIQVDDFTKKLWEIYEESRSSGPVQPVSLGLFRSDYMIDSTTDQWSLKQIEFNTIASSFAGMSVKVGQLHRYILETQYGTRFNMENLPPNNCLSGLARGLVEAHNLFVKKHTDVSGNKSPVVLFLIEPVNRNIFDQRWIEYAIQDHNKHIRVIWKTLHDVFKQGKIDENRNLFVEQEAISLVYFREGYSPTSFLTEKEWEARRMIEQSTAIKCPSIHYHLAGTKKVQQELFRPGVVERYLTDHDAVDIVRGTFAGQYSLDLDKDGDKNAKMAKENPERFVMKPQREGGGNNIFGEDIQRKLNEIHKGEERKSYILMDKIKPPSFKNYMIRVGDPVECCEMVSELGIYGVVIGSSEEIITNAECGHLLRTKKKTQDEGGVAAGYAAIDSPHLI